RAESHTTGRARRTSWRRSRETPTCRAARSARWPAAQARQRRGRSTCAVTITSPSACGSGKIPTGIRAPMGRGQDDSPDDLPLFDGGEADTMQAAKAKLEDLADAPDGKTQSDIARIDTDRQNMPSAVLPRPLASDELRKELSDGGFSRIDTLPDGFADILKRRSLQPGDVVGEHYRLIEVLGGGAMGHVFTAENRAIGSTVAIKVLKPELLANPEFRQRFQYEAQAVGSIEHPNVARFLDVVVGDPTFLVMEYVPGETLATTLAREKAMSIQRAVHIATRLAWGLDAAHAAGIIHRDLKPANVILTADREVGE